MSEQQVIHLNSTNSIEILNQYIDIAQKNGAFALPEADLLKRCRDILLRATPDEEILPKAARNLFIQAVNKGQSKGCYSLDDASILHKVCQYVNANLDDPLPEPKKVEQEQQERQDTQTHQSNPNIQQVENNLDELSAPIPLRSGPRII